MIFILVSDIKNMKLLLGAQYFIYFGTLGVVLPYFNLFCHHLGFSGFEIGILSSVKTAAVVIFPVLWAMAADRFNARKPILVLCTLMGSALWALLFFTKKFIPILCILTLYSVFYAPIIAFLEAFAMDILGKEKKKYGKSRVWGTVAFIGVSLALGKVLSSYPTEIIIPLILFGMVMQTSLALKMPGRSKILDEKEDNSLLSPSERLRSENSGSVAKSKGAWSDFRAFFSMRTSLFLMAAFLMLASHGAYYGFFSIYLESLGFKTTFIGFAWALSSIAEIAVMVCSNRIFSRFDLKTVLLISFAAAFLRWILLFITSPSVEISAITAASPGISAFSPTLSLVILLSQLLHAFTYGAFHIASILAIDKLSPKGTTFGQAVNNAVTYGAGMMTGFLLSGIFYDRFQGYLFLASGAAAIVGGTIILYVEFDSPGT